MIGRKGDRADEIGTQQEEPEEAKENVRPHLILLRFVNSSGPKVTFIELDLESFKYDVAVAYRWTELRQSSIIRPFQN